MSTENFEKTNRPGLKAGQASEFTIIAPLKQGGADRIREKFKNGFDQVKIEQTDKVGTVHDLRYVIFDNDTRLLFCTTFDGDWDAYIDDFATIIPQVIDEGFEDLEGYPGVKSPLIKEYIKKYQVTAISFYSAYPGKTVKDIKSALATKKAFEELLDSATGSF